MSPILLSMILFPILEIYLFIKIGSQIGAFNTILLIFITAIIGVYYAKYEGLNTLRSAVKQLLFINSDVTRLLFRYAYQLPHAVNNGTVKLHSMLRGVEFATG